MTVARPRAPKKAETYKKEFSASDAYSLRRLVAAVIAGTESGDALAEKMKQYVYESEEEFEKMLEQEMNKKRLADLLVNCTGVIIESYNRVSRERPNGEVRDYDVSICIRYEDADAFVRHHKNVTDVIQQLMNQDRLIASVYQTIKSTHIRAGGTISDNQYAVELEGL
jgi:hypothetical protein